MMLKALRIAENQYLNDPQSVENLRIIVPDDHSNPEGKSIFNDDFYENSQKSKITSELSQQIVTIQNCEADCDETHTLLENNQEIGSNHKPSQFIANFDYSVELTQPDVLSHYDAKSETETETENPIPISTLHSDNSVKKDENTTNCHTDTNFTVNINITDPLFISNWPKALWERSYFPYLPAPDVIINKLHDKTTKNVIMYLVENTFRVEDNLALQMSLMLSKKMNLPLLIVVSISENELNQIQTYESQQHIRNAIKKQDIFSFMKSSIAQDSLYRKSMLNMMKLLAFKNLLHIKHSLEIIGLVVRSSSSNNIMSKATTSNIRYNSDAFRIYNCLEYFKSNLNIICMFTDSVNNPIQRQTIQSLCQLVPDIAIIAIDNDRICILPLPLTNNKVSNSNDNTVIMNESEEILFKEIYLHTIESEHINTIFNMFENIEISDTNVETSGITINLKDCAATNSNSNSSNVYAIPWAMLETITTNYVFFVSSHADDTSNPMLYSSSSTSLANQTNLTFSNKKLDINNINNINKNNNQNIDVTVVNDSPFKNINSNFSSHNTTSMTKTSTSTSTATPNTTSISRRITFGDDTILQKRQRETTPYVLTDSSKTPTTTNVLNKKSACSGIQQLVSSYTRDSVYMNIFTLLHKIIHSKISNKLNVFDDFFEYINKSSYFLKEHYHNTHLPHITNQSQTKVPLNVPSSNSTNYHNIISDILLLRSVLYECIDNCLISPRKIINFIQLLSSQVDNNNNNSNSNNNNLSKNYVISIHSISDASLPVVIFNHEHISNLMFSIDYSRHLVSRLYSHTLPLSHPHSLLNNIILEHESNSKNTLLQNDESVRNKSYYENYLSFLDLLPLACIEKMQLFNYILKVLKDVTKNQSQPFIANDYIKETSMHSSSNNNNNLYHSNEKPTSFFAANTNNSNVYNNNNTIQSQGYSNCKQLNIYPSHIRNATTFNNFFNSIQNMLIQTGAIPYGPLLDFYLIYLFLEISMENGLKVALIEIATHCLMDPEKCSSLPLILHRFYTITLPMLFGILNDNFEQLATSTNTTNTENIKNTSNNYGKSPSVTTTSKYGSSNYNSSRASAFRGNVNSKVNYVTAIKPKQSNSTNITQTPISNQNIQTNIPHMSTNNSNGNSHNNGYGSSVQDKIINLVTSRIVQTLGGEIIVNKFIFEWSSV